MAQSPTTLDRLVRRVATQVRCAGARALRAARRLLGRAWPRSRCSLRQGARWDRGRCRSRSALRRVGRARRRARGARCKRVRPADAARLADRAFGLDDRVATALEWADRGRTARRSWTRWSPTPPRASRRWSSRACVRRVDPARGRLLPMPGGRWPSCWRSRRRSRCRRGACPTSRPAARKSSRSSARASPLLEERSRPAAKDALKPPSFEERDFAQRAGGTRRPPRAGDLSAIFKDTSLANAAARLQQLPEEGRRAAEDARAGGPAARSPVGLHDQPVQDGVQEVEGADGRAAPGPDLAPEAQGAARGDGAARPQGRRQLERRRHRGHGGARGRPAPIARMEAMQKALDKMRAQDEAQRSGKGLRGRPRDRPRRQRPRARRGGEGGGPDDQDFGEGEGLMPGKGRSDSPKGEATQRLRGNPYDVGVEGESRRGPQGRLRHEHDGTGRADGLAPAVPRRHRAVPEDDGGRDRAGVGPARLPLADQGLLPGARRAIDAVPAATRHAFFTPEFLAQLERLSLLSRRIFRGSVKGERRSPRRGHSVEFCRLPRLRRRRRPALRRLEHLRPARSAARQALRRRGGSLPAPARRRLGLDGLRRALRKLDYAVRLAAALGFVGLVNLERVGRRHPARAGGRGLAADARAATRSCR